MLRTYSYNCKEAKYGETSLSADRIGGMMDGEKGNNRENSDALFVAISRGSGDFTAVVGLTTAQNPNSN